MLFTWQFCLGFLMFGFSKEVIVSAAECITLVHLQDPRFRRYLEITGDADDRKVHLSPYWFSQNEVS